MKKFTSGYVMVIVLATTMVSCFFSKKSEKSGPASQEITTSDTTLFASIQRTPCYGRCPSYKAVIYQSGRVVYEGLQFVDKRGKYEAMVSEEEREMLLNKAKEINYFGLNDKYDSNITDLPSCLTTINAEGKRKSIYNRHEGPDSLRDFQQLFDKILDAQDWKLLEAPATPDVEER